MYNTIQNTLNPINKYNATFDLMVSVVTDIPAIIDKGKQYDVVVAVLNEKGKYKGNPELLLTSDELFNIQQFVYNVLCNKNDEVYVCLTGHVPCVKVADSTYVIHYNV